MLPDGAADDTARGCHLRAPHVGPAGERAAQHLVRLLAAVALRDDLTMHCILDSMDGGVPIAPEERLAGGMVTLEGYFGRVVQAVCEAPRAVNLRVTREAIWITPTLRLRRSRLPEADQEALDGLFEDRAAAGCFSVAVTAVDPITRIRSTRVEVRGVGILRAASSREEVRVRRGARRSTWASRTTTS